MGLDLAQAMGTLTKHGVKQVDRLHEQSKRRQHWAFFRIEERNSDSSDSGAVSHRSGRCGWPGTSYPLLTLAGHDRAVDGDWPWARTDLLLRKTVAPSSLKGNHRCYECEVLLQQFREVLPRRGACLLPRRTGASRVASLLYALTTELAFEYVIRLRGHIYVTSCS